MILYQAGTLRKLEFKNIYKNMEALSRGLIKDERR